MSSYRAECPAGAALALVLDVGDGALLPPVHLVGVGHVRRRQERGAAGLARLAQQALAVPATQHTHRSVTKVTAKYKLVFDVLMLVRSSRWTGQIIASSKDKLFLMHFKYCKVSDSSACHQYTKKTVFLKTMDRSFSIIQAWPTFEYL